MVTTRTSKSDAVQEQRYCWRCSAATRANTPTAHAGYRYVHLDIKDVRTHQNYLVLRVTPDEKAQVETLCCRVGSYTWVYLWEAEGRRWLEFPSAPTAHHIDPSSYGGTYPKFQPAHAAFVTPSKLTEADTTATNTSGLMLTQSGDWWWIAGDTYPHKDILKAAGARWSKSRRQWYYKGHDLPA